jgi:thiamine-monophosphate kinase
MKIRDIGEDRLVRELTRGLTAVGDDCAIIGGPRDTDWALLKTDAVVEGIHFEEDEDAALVGRKALCRAASDIAAMGGLPRHALVTLAVSRDTDVARLKKLYAGLKRTARELGIEIVGGETVRSPGPLFLSIALTGGVERARCVTRGGGRTGDLLYVTGTLGGSIRGKHLRFTPRIAEARWLTENFRIRAMMDLSDGLGADLPRLALASAANFELEREKIPATRGCTVEQAISDGEDYELLFAIAPRDAAKLEVAWKKKFPKLRLTRIGRLAAHKPAPDLPKGYDHFA